MTVKALHHPHMTNAGTLFCTKCGTSRTPDDSPCQSCGAQRYQSPALLLRAEGPRENGGDEPNEVRAIASELRSLPKGEQVLIFDAMIFAARAKGSVRESDVRTVYEALTLTRSTQVDRISVLKKLLSNAKTRSPSAFPELHEPTSLWLMSALLKLTGDAGNLSASEFLNDFANHVGLKPSAREAFFAKARDWLSLDTVSKFLDVFSMLSDVAYTYNQQGGIKGGIAALREAGKHEGTVSEFSEIANRLRLPVRVVREPSRIERQLLNRRRAAYRFSWRWWPRRRRQPHVADFPPSYLPETDEDALLRYFVRSLSEDMTWLRHTRCLEWPSTKRFRKTAALFLSAMCSEVARPIIF